MAQDDQRLDIENQEEPEEQTLEPETADAPEEGEAQQEGKKKKEKDPPDVAIYTWLRELTRCMVFVVLLFVFVVRLMTVDGDSMLPTLRNGEMVLLLSGAMYQEPENGDIVVAYIPLMGKPLIKRVIATEGQTVDIDFTTHQVWVDGELLDEPYISEPIADPESGLAFPQTVPEGHIFILGDNRNNSRDSRDIIVGMVDTRCIMGKVLARVAPMDAIGKVE